MKKIVLAVVIAMAGACGIYQANQNNNLSELQIENMEALAEGENYSGYQKVVVKEKRNGQIVLNCSGNGNLICEGSSN